MKPNMGPQVDSEDLETFCCRKACNAVTGVTDRTELQSAGTEVQPPAHQACKTECQELSFVSLTKRKAQQELLGSRCTAHRVGWAEQIFTQHVCV